MEFLFSEDQEQFRENIARFLADRSPTTEVRKLMEDDKGYDPEVWALLSNQLGLCGIAIAEQYGGAGFGPQELAIACVTSPHPCPSAAWASDCAAAPLALVELRNWVGE